jgi:hypothetical protein
MTRGTLPLWLLSMTARRVRGNWRLLSVVTAIAIVACTLVTSVGLLVFATEQGGVRSAFRTLPAEQSIIDVRMLRPHVALKTAKSLSDNAIKRALGDAATSAVNVVADSEFLAVPQLDGAVPALGYFGELDAVKTHATLLKGTWPSGSVNHSGAEISVAVPEPAAHAFGLSLGSSFSTKVADATATATTTVTAKVVGIYRAQHPKGAYWDRDPLNGAGYIAGFPAPDAPTYSPTNAFGPVLVAPGGLTTASLPVRSLDIQYTPDFARIGIAQLAPLVDRLNTATDDVPLRIGLVATSVIYSSGVGDGASEIASALIVMRSTVVVVSLLLLGLALATLGQAGRLSNDARAAERQSMRARGASDGQLLGLAVFEALIIGVITMVASPLLAGLVYRVLAAQPPMVAAGMPSDAGLPPIVWAVAAGVSILFIVILIAPLLRRGNRYLEDDPSRHRQSRASGVMRSGLDLALVVVAIVVFWQLRSYRSPVNYTASLAVDPVLVAGPAIMVLAGALLAVRLIPLVSRLLGRAGLRARGALGPLAIWEVARRPRRLIAAVVLLTLALAVGTFGQTFLSTWRQSQVDQARFVVGASVRVPADDHLGGAEAGLLATGATGTPQPVIRRIGTVTASGPALTDAVGDALSGTSALVLGLSSQAREVIDRGRLAQEGGAKIRSLVKTPTQQPTSVPLAQDAVGLAATIQIGSAAVTIPGLSARIHAILQDSHGLLSTVDLGFVPVDGREHQVEAIFPTLPKGTKIAAPLHFVGMQSDFIVTDADALWPHGEGADTPVSILVKDLAALEAPLPDATSDAPQPTVAVKFTGNEQWHAHSSDPFADTPSTTKVPQGWQIRLGVIVPLTIGAKSAQFVLTGWTPELSIPAVMSKGLAKRMNITPGIPLTLVMPDGQLGIIVSGTSSLIPGSRSAVHLTANNGGVDPGQPDTVVVDQQALSRALLQDGVSDPTVDEWWVDVPTGHGQAYLDAHPQREGVPAAQSSEAITLQLQQDPMRVSAQAALWLTILGAALLAAIGFAMHTAAGMRSRRTEFAQLRAVGLSRRMLVGLIGAESLVLCILGTAFGVGLGALVGWLVGPLITVSPDGTPTVPSVLVVIPWLQVAALVGVIAAALVVIVAGIAGSQKSADPAQILRGANE